MPYTYSGEENDMTSFTWQEPGAPKKTYRVVWTWRNTRQVSATGLCHGDAVVLCKSLNMLADQYGQDDDYTVEEE